MSDSDSGSSARLGHVSLVANDWRRLADFYQRALGCRPIPPERDLHGDWISEATGIPGARIRGIHLRLPGDDPAGPTIEIFQYEPAEPSSEKPVNRPGYAHIAVAVDAVAAVSEAIVDHGGSAVGPVTRRPVPGAGTITFQYVRDPEGNVIELQHWEDESAPA